MRPTAAVVNAPLVLTVTSLYAFMLAVAFVYRNAVSLRLTLDPTPPGHVMRKKPRFPAHSRVSWEAWPNAGMGGWGRNRTSIWRFRKRMRLPAREDLQNLISSEFISGSKHANFKNRTESAQSRALERIAPFGEEWAGSAD
jgi:hypothetical protein